MAKTIVRSEAVTRAVVNAFSYDPATGLFTRKHSRWPQYQGLETAGICNKASGYLYLTLATDEGKRMILAHRVAWLLQTGAWPKEFIDHIDGNKANNVFSNLREADAFLNAQNQRHANARTASKVLGASKCRDGKFRAVIGHKGQQFRLGTFESADEANAAYLEAKRRLHPGCTI